MSRKGLVRIVLVLISVALLFLGATIWYFNHRHASTLASETEPALAFAYMINFAGDFLKIDRSTQKVIAHGNLAAFDKTRKLVPILSSDGNNAWGWEGCAVCYKQLRYDKSNGRFYILATVGPGLTKDGSSRSRVLVFSLPNLNLVGSIELDPEIDSYPNILVTPSGEQLLVSYRLSEGDPHTIEYKLIDVIDFYDTRTMTKVSSIRDETVYFEEDSRLNARDVRFGNDAYFVDENTIYDPSDSIAVRDRKLKFVDGRVVVLQRKSKDGFEKKTLEEWQHITLSSPDPWQYTRPFWGPGRKHVLLEQMAQPFLDEALYTYNLGNFAIYEVATGKQLVHFQEPTLAGVNGEAWCMSPSADTTYYSVEHDNNVAEQVLKNILAQREERISIDAIRRGTAEVNWYAISITPTVTITPLQRFEFRPGLITCEFADR